MRFDLSKVFAAGLVATVPITVISFFAPPFVSAAGGPADFAGVLATLLGGLWIVGLFAHFFIGAVVLPCLYASIGYGLIGGPPALRGFVWGLLLWAVMQLVIVPATDGAFLSLQYGDLVYAGSSLAGHLIYGVLLGVGLGRPRAIGEFHPHRHRHAETSWRRAG